MERWKKMERISKELKFNQQNQTEDAEKQEHRKRVTVACMLLEKGAFVDIKNKNGAEPLQCCRPETIRKGFKQFVEQK